MDFNPLHYITSHSCIDSVPPLSPSNIRVSKVSLLRRVGPLVEPELTALPLTTPGLRPGWVILRVDQLAPNFFTPPCATPNNDCLGPDRYVVEESSTSNATGLAVIATQSFTYSTPPLDIPFFRGLHGQSRFYRVRFYPGAKTMNGCVLNTNVTDAVTIPDKIKVLIRNSLTLTSNNDLRSDSKIVRVRIAADLATLHSGTDPEQLTKDACQPQTASIDQVLPRNTWPASGIGYELDDGQLRNTSRIHIGLGDWAPMDPPCGGPNQRKRPFFISNGQTVYRYVEFNLQGRFGSTVINFTSDTGNVAITMQAANSGGTVSPSANFLHLSTPNSDPIGP